MYANTTEQGLQNATTITTTTSTTLTTITTLLTTLTTFLQMDTTTPTPTTTTTLILNSTLNTTLNTTPTTLTLNSTLTTLNSTLNSTLNTTLTTLNTTPTLTTPTTTTTTTTTLNNTTTTLNTNTTTTLNTTLNTTTTAGGPPTTLTVALQRLFTSAVILAVNLLTVVTFARVRALRTLSNKLVVCLASTDLMVGAITFVSALAWVPGLASFLHLSPEACVFRLCWFFMCCSASMLNISLIALERYLYIVRPYLHVRYVTPAVVKSAVAFVWLFGIAFGSSPIFFADYGRPEVGCDFYVLLGPGYVVWGTCTVFFSTSFLTLCFYSLIARLALKMRRSVGSFHQTTAASNAARMTLLRMALTSIKAPAVVFGVFLLCWSPHISVYLIHHLVTPLPQKVRGWFTTVGLFNSAMNFFVYLTLNAQFRRAVLGYFRRSGRKGRSKSGISGESGSSACVAADARQSESSVVQRSQLQVLEEGLSGCGEKGWCEGGNGVVAVSSSGHM